MTRRRKVWEPRAESVPDVLPEWRVSWHTGSGYEATWTFGFRTARIAWDAWQQVKGAPAFGSCRVRRIVEGDDR